MATDSQVVSPLFFASGDIGSLSVHDTINDVAMMGARPLYLPTSFILKGKASSNKVSAMVIVIYLVSLSLCAISHLLCIIQEDNRTTKMTKEPDGAKYPTRRSHLPFSACILSN